MRRILTNLRCASPESFRQTSRLKREAQTGKSSTPRAPESKRSEPESEFVKH